MPDNGLACLAGALVDAGHEAQVLDYGAVSTVRRLFPPDLSSRIRPLAEKLFLEGKRLSPFEKFRFLRAGMKLDRHQAKEISSIARSAAEQAAAFRADVVGLKLWNGDGFIGSVKIAQAVRERLPTAKILGGGPQVDYFRHHILDYTSAFDVLVRGEGERVLPELVERMARGRDWHDLPGILWKDSAGPRSNAPEPLRRLDDLPLPRYDRDLYPALSGDEKIKIGVVDESRGCPNRCAFCIHPIKSGGKWEVKSPQRVAAEMRRMTEALNTRRFIYSGSNTSARVAVGIAEEILRQGMDVRYGCFGHVRGIAKADFGLLRQSGCVAIFYGLESGSPRVLREGLNKPLDLAEAERVLRETKEAGICCIASIIFPAPFEDERSRRETFDLLRRVRPESIPVTIPGMIPGTLWETEPQKYGFEMARRKDFWEYGLTYKIKLLFPPGMWKPLPYRLNGKSSKRLLRECGEFVRDLENDGLLTDVSHELVLMADALGERGRLREFRDRCRAMFLGGDAEGIQEMVRRINGGPCATPVTAMEQPAGRAES